MVLIYPGPSHSDDSIAIYLPTRQLLYGGCTVRSDGVIANKREADFPGWIQAIERYLLLGASTVVPGHKRRFDPAMLEESRRAAAKAARTDER